jgi:hypothetical protein
VFAAVLGGALLAIVEILVLGSFVGLGPLGALVLGLGLASGQAAWIAGRGARGGAVGATAALAAIAFIVIVVAVFGTLYSNADSFR